MPGPSDAESLGNELRTARQQRNLTLLEVEKQIRVRAKFLEALEQANYTVLPSVVHTRGFLRNYARFLEMDGDMAVARYDAVLLGGRRRGRRTNTLPEPPPKISMTPAVARSTQTMTAVKTTVAQPVPEAPHRRSWLRIILLMVIVLAGIAGLVIFGGRWLQSVISKTTSPILSPLPRDATATRTPTVTFTPMPLVPTSLPNPNALNQPTGTGIPGGATSVSVVLQIVQRTVLIVEVDGQLRFMGAPAPDTVLKYQGTKIHLRIGNAHGVNLSVNNQNMGVLGARGEIFDQTFTANGVIKPTPTSQAANLPDESTLLPVSSVLISPSPLAHPSAVTLTATGTSPPNTRLPTATFITEVVTGQALPLTSSVTRTATLTRTPTNSATPSLTATLKDTPLFLPHVTSTVEGGDVRPN